MTLLELLEEELARLRSRKASIYEKGRIAGCIVCIELVNELHPVPMEEDLVKLRQTLKKIIKQPTTLDIVMQRGFNKSLRNLYEFCYARVFSASEPLHGISKRQRMAVAMQSNRTNTEFYGLSRLDASNYIKGRKI